MKKRGILMMEDEIIRVDVVDNRPNESRGQSSGIRSGIPNQAYDSGWDRIFDKGSNAIN